MSIRLIALCLLVCLAAPACGGGDGLYKKTKVIMGTYVTITVARGGLPEVVVRAAVADAYSEIERIDRLMSTYKPESQLSQINREAGMRPVKADPEVIAVIQDALDVATMTGGAFDPTVGPLVRLWGIGGDKARVPGKDEIDAARRLVGFSHVILDKKAGTVFIENKGMAVDLGGIAKGYASDRAVEILKARGIKGGIVAVAGDLKLFGAGEGGKPWKIGIQHPRKPDALLTELEVNDAATSTSGDYERYFIKDGRRYCHILDPKTGYPASGLMSVTVLARDSYLADSLATGLFVMGPEKANAFARSHPEIEVLMVAGDGSISSTGRFRGVTPGSL